MKRFWLWFMFIACLSTAPNPLQASASDYMVQPTWLSRQNSSLRLTAGITEQTYCSNGDIRMFLRLRYTNLGTEPIILNRGSFAITSFTISSDLTALAKKHYEAVVNLDFASSVQPEPTHGRTPPTDRFVIIAPSQTYEIDTKRVFSDVGMPNYPYFTLGRSLGKRLDKGAHVLQVKIRTWDEPLVLAEELSVAWRRHGFLWWQEVTSEPLRFKIEDASLTVKCS